jgi:hypothetical protein
VKAECSKKQKLEDAAATKDPHEVIRETMVKVLREETGEGGGTGASKGKGKGAGEGQAPNPGGSPKSSCPGIHR